MKRLEDPKTREQLLEEVVELRRQRESALEDAESARQEGAIHLRCVLESLSEAVLITDLQDIVQDCNARVEELTGFSRAEILGKPAYEQLLPPDQWQALRARNAQRAMGIEERYENRLLRKDGSTVWVEIHASPLSNAAGEILGSISANVDITERKLAEEALRRSAVLQERNRIAQEMHDTLAQAFTGVIVQLGAAERILAEGQAETREHIQRARDLAREGLSEARRAVRALRPESLEYADLGEALARLVTSMTAGTSVQATFRVSGEPRPLSQDIAQNLFRIGQEALTNVIRHADARHARIELTFEPQELRLRIADDGCGLEPRSADQSDGFGLTSMRERAERIGGRFSISSQPEQGTEALVVVPLPPEDRT